jgi:hypothetical protein
MTIEEIRKKYPETKKLTDEQLKAYQQASSILVKLALRSIRQKFDKTNAKN